MSPAPLISVVMAAHAAEATLPDSVASVLAQSVGDVELIVVDDGSPVPVAEVLRDVRDRRLRIVRLAENAGISRARNAGLREARAPALAHLDADDLWEPAYAERMLPLLEDPGVGLAYCDARIIGHPHGLTRYIPDATVHPMDRFPKFAEQNPVPSPTALMRTAAVRGVGGYATWLRQAMDYQLYAKLIAAGWRFAYRHEPLVAYRWPEPTRGISHDHRGTQRAELKLWLAFVARHPRTPGPRRQVRTRVPRELRRVLGR